MAKARTERLLNLLFVLLNAKQPVTREQLRIRVPGYEGSSDDAFERMFERDKEALRELNIPVSTKPVDIYHDDVVGYLVDRDSWLMPEIQFSQSERILLSLAASAWTNAQVASAAYRGFERLSPEQVRNTPESAYTFGIRNDSISEILAAITDQVSVQFEYQSASSSEVATRNVDPWKLILHSGHWYLIGFDLDRGESRSFRIDRLIGLPRLTDQEIIEPTPMDLNARDLVATWQASEANSSATARITVRPGTASELRVLASEIVYSDEQDILTIPYLVSMELSRKVARNCEAIIDIDSEQIANEVSDLVSAVLEAHKDGK